MNSSGGNDMNQAVAYLDQDRSSVESLLQEHAPLVKKVGLHLIARLPPDVELGDLIQVGMMGLLKAIENYSDGHGASFETYASIRIRGAMLDEVRRMGWSPRSMQQKAKRVREAIRNVESSKQAEASDSEIAEELGMELDDYHSMSGELVATRLVSLDEEQDEYGSELTSPDVSPESYLEQEEFQQAMKESIQSLPEKEKLVMSLYYNEGLNLREIGAILDVTESRVCQIHGQALTRTRARMKSWLES
jgi:RNA polymerase sigma factor FliA